MASSPEELGPTSIEPKSNATVDLVKGIVKGNTADLLGLPADVANLIKQATSKNSEPAPIGYGSAYFRKLFFGEGAVEDASIVETAGSMVSAGGLAGATKAMIVGAIPKLAFEGISSKSASKILTELDRLNTNEQAVKFFQATGLFKGVDDKARAAISDAPAVLNPKVFSKDRDELGKVPIVLSGNTRLRDVLSHAELYKLYPQLKETRVVGDVKMRLNEASFNPTNNTITLGPQASSDKAMASLLHEVQHVIQEQENFVTGTNPNVLREFNAVELTPKRLQNLRKLREEGNPVAIRIAEKLNADTRKAFAEYKANPAEAEARFTESTMKLSQSDLEKRIEEILKNPLPVSFWDK
jgi:hypothetical protein